MKIIDTLARLFSRAQAHAKRVSVSRREHEARIFRLRQQEWAAQAERAAQARLRYQQYYGGPEAYIPTVIDKLNQPLPWDMSLRAQLYTKPNSRLTSFLNCLW